MYSSKKDAIHIPFTLETYDKMAKEEALLDSRGTHNFMDKQMVRRLNLEQKSYASLEKSEMSMEQKTRKEHSQNTPILKHPLAKMSTYNDFILWTWEETAWSLDSCGYKHLNQGLTERTPK